MENTPTSTLVETPQEKPTYATPPSARIEKKGHGCFFRGCMGCLGFLVILVIAAVVMGLYARSTLVNFALQWTDTQAMELPDTSLEGSEEIVALQEWAKIVKAIDEKTAGTYVVDQNMIDVVIQSEELTKDRLAVVLGDQGIVTAHMSYPLQEFGVETVEGRYLNAILGVTMSYDRGRAELYLQDMQVPGKTLPAKILDLIKKENLGPRMLQEPDVYEFITRFDSVSISGNKAYLEIADVGGGTAEAEQAPSIEEIFE